MHKIASYSSLTLAHLHAAHLRAQGIMAGVVGETLVNADPLLSFLRPHCFDLYIATVRHEHRAKQLIDDIGTPELPDDWEADAVPDLTKLDAAHIPPCPHCATTLDPRKPFGPCAACNHPTDLAQLVIDTHGPEALIDCYTHLAPPEDLTDDEIRSVPLDCVRCQTPLDDHPDLQGQCPKCKLPFNRREIVTILLNNAPESP